MTLTEPVLRTHEITKRFPGVVALDRVSIELRPNEILGLVGENGSGKSTLLKTLAGVHRPDAGSIELRGRTVRLSSLLEAMRAGVGIVFQEQSLVPNLTVAENLYLGHEGPAVTAGVFRWGRLNTRAAAVLERVACQVEPDATVESLSFAERQMVEIARALAVGELSGQVLAVLFDEPTSVLESEDIQTLFTQIRKLRESASVIFVSHRLDEVLEISDRLYVMRNGAVVAEHSRGEVSVPELHALMVGRARDRSYYREDEQREIEPSGQPRLSVRGLSGAHFSDVSFEVEPGEIVGIVGVEGSGREAVCRALFGITEARAGQITLSDRRVAMHSPSDAKAQGIGYVPAERKTEGLVLDMPVTDNVSLASMASVQWGPFIDHRKERSVVGGWIDRLRVKTAGLDRPVRNLSGGNQQKLVLAKWLLRKDLRLLILDHPTRGLDVGAKAEVYELIRQLAARGISMLLLGDTLEESISLSNRLVAMKDGRVTGIIPAPAGNKPGLIDVVGYIV